MIQWNECEFFSQADLVWCLNVSLTNCVTLGVTVQGSSSLKEMHSWEKVRDASALGNRGVNWEEPL